MHGRPGHEDGATSLDAEVAVAGGGPCGLVLALELGRRGVRTVVLNDRPGTSPHPQANATQARTMEHFRRLGVAERVRRAGLPSDYRPDIAYFTRFTGYELARFRQPSSGETEQLARTDPSTASVAELPHRASQMYVESILFDAAQALSAVDLRFGRTVVGFEDHADHVAVNAQSASGEVERVTARYLVGADGVRGRIRAGLGIRYAGARDTDRPFLAGAMYQIHFRSGDVYGLLPHPEAWQYWAVTPDRRGLMIALDGREAFVVASQLRDDEDPATMTDEDAEEIVFRVMGERFDLEILTCIPWTAGLTLVAERFQAGRVLLAGDAVHLFTPTGGLGYNTAVEDAVNLGWKLAAVLRGWGGPSLLASYELERKPIAERNTGFARTLAQSVGGLEVPLEIEDGSPAGEDARRRVGEHLAAHARNEFNIPGIALGARYDGTPLIAGDGTMPPPDRPTVYEPSATPGGRAPHAWLSDGRSLFDALGPEFTLLDLGATSEAVEPLVEAARARGVPLTLLDLSGEDLGGLYEAELALVRPDQVVCWRGDEAPPDALELIDRVTGGPQAIPAPGAPHAPPVPAASTRS